jgi:glycosyltransferase involved in cell wall biosynthesis
MARAKYRAALHLLRFWRGGWAEWIANSRSTLNSAFANLPLGRAVARAVPLGVSDEWLEHCLDRNEARSALNLDAERLVILSLGRVVRRKGHGVLADALALLPPQLSARVSWWIVGPILEADHADAIRAKLERSGVDGTFLGKLPLAEVKQRLVASDLFCLPGFMDENGQVEGFGLVFLEAGAYGIPSVATHSGGIPEAIDDGATGLLVPERDEQALAKALCLLLEEDAMRHGMGRAARLRAERSNWRAVMHATYFAEREKERDTPEGSPS